MMKKTLIFLFVLVVSLIFFFTLSETLFAFEWIERGVTVKSEEPTDSGVRLFLEDQTLRTFVVEANQELLTDPVKENILVTFTQVLETYNLPTSNIEFKLKPDIFKLTLVLSETNQTVGITYHGLQFPDTIVPTISALLNEFNAWEGLQIKTLQIVYHPSEFQLIIAPETEVPLIDVKLASPQPDKKLVAELAPLYNQIAGWEQVKPDLIELFIGKDKLQANIEEESRATQIAFHRAYPTASEVKRASRMVGIFSSWKNSKFKKLLLNVKSNTVDSVIALAEFKHKGKDLLPHIPAGMNFWLDDKIHFNFRVSSGKYFVELKNEYTNEEKLIWQLSEAIKDPILYIQIHDPDYFYRQLEGLRNRQAEVYSEMLASMQEANEKLKQTYDELLTRHKKLENSYENLRLAHETFLHAYLTLENSGFLGSGEIDKNTIARILVLKAENIDLTVKEMEKLLEEEQIKASSKVIHLIYSVYFNDFRE